MGKFWNIKPNQIIEVYIRKKQQITQLTHLLVEPIYTGKRYSIVMFYNTAYTFKQAMRLQIAIDPKSFYVKIVYINMNIRNFKSTCKPYVCTAQVPIVYTLQTIL